MVMLVWPMAVFAIALYFGGYFYVEASKAGMKKEFWALAGLVAGPVLMPLFTFHRYIQMKREAGLENIWMAA